MFTPLTGSNLRQIMYWLSLSENEYQSWSVTDLFINAYLEYHQYFQTHEKSPTLEEAHARIQIDGNYLVQLGFVPYYVEWFVRKQVYPLFIVKGDMPVGPPAPIVMEPKLGPKPSSKAITIKID